LPGFLALGFCGDLSGIGPPSVQCTVPGKVGRSDRASGTFPPVRPSAGRRALCHAALVPGSGGRPDRCYDPHVVASPLFQRRTARTTERMRTFRPSAITSSGGRSVPRLGGLPVRSEDARGSVGRTPLVVPWFARRKSAQRSAL
jgi:hypothetical protein